MTKTKPKPTPKSTAPTPRELWILFRTTGEASAICYDSLADAKFAARTIHSGVVIRRFVEAV
jgi:hypothetical protein